MTAYYNEIDPDETAAAGRNPGVRLMRRKPMNFADLSPAGRKGRAYRFLRWRAANGGAVADLRTLNMPGAQSGAAMPVDAAFRLREMPAGRWLLPDEPRLKHREGE